MITMNSIIVQHINQKQNGGFRWGLSTYLVLLAMSFGVFISYLINAYQLYSLSWKSTSYSSFQMSLQQTEKVLWIYAKKVSFFSSSIL